MALGLFEPVPGSGVFSNGASVAAGGIAYGDSAGKLTASVDSDTGDATVARARIGFASGGTTDRMYLSHYDCFTSTDFALMQTAAGTTILNAKTGATLTFQVNANQKFQIATGAATFSSGVPVTISDTTAGGFGTGALICMGGGYFASACRLGGALTVSLTNTDGAATFLNSTTTTIAGGLTDAYGGGLQISPTYSAATALTVTRHNYLNLANPTLSGVGPAALTDACLFRVNAAAGTHKMVDGATTKTTPGGVDAWVKVNINGTLYYVPAYTSKTA